MPYHARANLGAAFWNYTPGKLEANRFERAAIGDKDDNPIKTYLLSMMPMNELCCPAACQVLDRVQPEIEILQAPRCSS